MQPNDGSTIPPTQPGSTRMRTSDKEREQVAEILRAAMTEGRLDLAEGEERLATAYAAKFRDELGPLTTDLPGVSPGAPRACRPGCAGRHAGACAGTARSSSRSP